MLSTANGINHQKISAEQFRLGRQFVELGQIEAAKRAFCEAIRIDGRAFAAMLHLSALIRFDHKSDEAAWLLDTLSEAAAKADEWADGDAAMVLFALGKAWDDLGRWDDAMATFHRANRLRRKTLDVDVSRDEAAIERLIGIYDTHTLTRLGGGGAESELPVFIVGMPRSGTTLVEQILAAHPEVHGGGEQPFLQAILDQAVGPGNTTYPAFMRMIDMRDCRPLGETYLKALGPPPVGKRRITDKLPGNFQFAGLIHLCLPGARIIHCRRDPRDSCLSMYFTHFGQGNEFTYRLSDLGRAWRAYHRMMAHWERVLPPNSILHVDYEDMVGNVEGVAQRIVAHCGLDWNTSCLAFHGIKRPVSTASAAQVRQPIYNSSVGRWRNYARHLRTLFRSLEGL